MTAPLNHAAERHHMALQQLHHAQQTRKQPIRVTTRQGGTTDADIQDRERDNLANQGDF